jgi:hypothetical protein
VKDRKANAWNPLGFTDGAANVAVLAVSLLVVLYDVIGAAGPIGLP